MGKPYQSELGELAATYEAAQQFDIAPLARSLAECRSLPLIAVGSGGSLTAAHFAAWLHERLAGVIARAATPLDAVEAVSFARQSAVLLLSAGGSNPDVIGAFRHLADAEPARLAVICGRAGSPLAERVRSYGYVDPFSIESPSGRDGFLATNSLLMFVAVLARGYARATAVGRPVPTTLRELLHPGRTPEQFAKDLSERCARLWERPTLVVLFGPETSSAAVDLESKFTEAALGVVQLADYRNFAHGRHHWLAKHGGSSAILALVTERDGALAERTLAILPPSIPRALQPIHGTGVEAALAAIVTAFFIAGLAGAARGIDPGRPGVPAFGRKIYNLRTFDTRQRPPGRLSPIQAIAIERKAGSGIEVLRERRELNQWLAAYHRFTKRLHAVEFGAIVLDYDGTLCETRARREGLGTEIAAELTRLLRGGVTIGIVTGRGQSVRKDLQRELPRDLWDRVLVGYYNGSDIAPLTDDSRPDAGSPSGGLAKVAGTLTKKDSLRICDVDPRPSQISVAPKPGVLHETVWDTLQRATYHTSAGATVVRSGHSFDVLAPGVSKSAVVRRVAQDGLAVLCIGDRGRWPGNDFGLLAGDYSLSAHEVSSDPGTCWNLAPPGRRGLAATLFYLQSLRLPKGGEYARLRLAGHEGRGKR